MTFPERFRVFLQFAWFATWEASRHKADLVFATSTPLTIAIPAMIAHFVQRIPFIFEVRDLWPQVPIALGALKNPVYRWGAKMLEKLAYQTAHHIVALSLGMAQGIEARGIPQEKITVIPNSCDIDLFQIDESAGLEIREQLGLTATQPLVVYAGAFGLANGVSYLVKIAHEMQKIAPDVRFLLVGHGKEETEIRQLAQELNVLHQNLWIWNSRPKMEIVKVFSAATITTSLFIDVPELWHNSANKFFDSLAASRPIAINYQGWQADILRDTKAGIILDPQNISYATQQLADYLYDAEKLKQARKSAFELASTRFQRDVMAEKLEAIFLKTQQ